VSPEAVSNGRCDDGVGASVVGVECVFLDVWPYASQQLSWSEIVADQSPLGTEIVADKSPLGTEIVADQPNAPTEVKEAV
jgi:hypothetical protein